MKYFIITLALLTWCAPIGCKAQENLEDKVSISVEPIKRFFHLMNYIESKSETEFNCKRGSKSEMKKVYKLNAKDLQLTSLIDSLLVSRAYSPPVSRYVKLFGYSNLRKPKGREAYKTAFMLFPNYCVDMTAGMPSLWVNFWKSKDRFRVDTILKKIEANKNNLTKSIIQNCTTLLPKDVDLKLETEIYLTIDGNRSGFQTGNMIIMDMIWAKSSDYDFQKFKNTLTHELHHVYYEKWLNDAVSIKSLNNRKKLLLEMQINFIKEGTAQQFTYPNYPQPVQEMYYNRELINELFVEWILLIRKTKKAFPKLNYALYSKNIYENATVRLRKYYPQKITSSAFSYRPTVLYYLSYHIYNTILEEGGKEKLLYVIENPNKLFAVYNKLHNETMLVPKIPDDVVELWTSNF